MSRLPLALLILCGLLFFSSSKVNAAGAEEEVEVYEEDAAGGQYEYEYEDDDSTLAASPDVTTTVFFPDYPNKRLVIGKDITVLIGLANNGNVPLNVTGVGASLHSPFDFNYYIQNFTAKGLSAIVQPHSQLSIEYKFRSDASLEPLEFWLSGFVDYTGTKAYRSTYVNGTIELIEPPVEMDVKRFFSYFLVLAGLGLVAYFGLQHFMKKQGKADRQRFTTRSKAEVDNSWDTPIYKPAVVQRSFRKKSVPKPKKV